MTIIKTDAAVRGAQSDRQRQIEYRVSGVRGLSVRLTPNGTKTWTLRYRTRLGEQRRYTIGVYPDIGLAAARNAAVAVLGDVARGLDPAKTLRTARSEARACKMSTVAELVEGYFEAARSGRHRPNARPKRPRSLNDERGYFERFIRPRFGRRPISELTRAEVQRFVDEIAAGSPATARLTRNLLRQAYNFAIRREITDRNPAQLTEVPRGDARERVLSDEELRDVWRATDSTAKGIQLAPGTAMAIRLAVLTLQRGGEIVGIHAREVDRAARQWIIPGERTKNHRLHVVPLSDFALEVLDRAFTFGSGKLEGYAFPSPRNPRRPITRHALSRAMARMTAVLGIDDAAVHDLRRTGATAMTGERIGVSRFVVSRVLNQVSDTGGAAAVTGIYDRNEYLPEKRRALEAWAVLVEEIVREERRSNVIKLAM